jgi:hypothetical protein
LNVSLIEYPRQKETHATSKEVKEMIRSALSSTREASQKQLGRPLKINAISFPEHFKGGVYAREIIYTAIEIYPEIKDILQGRPYLDNIRLAYGLNTGEALGYGPGADIEDYHSLLLHFDLQKSFLEVSMMIVTEFVDLRTRKFLIDDFGGCENVASVKKPPEPLKSSNIHKFLNMKTLTSLRKKNSPISRFGSNLWLTRNSMTPPAKRNSQTSAS